MLSFVCIVVGSRGADTGGLGAPNSLPISLGASPGLPTLVGSWTADTDELPNNLLPSVPLIGNGYLGVALSSVPFGSFQEPGLVPSRGPGAQCRDPGCGTHGPGLNLWLGSNAMWGVYGASADRADLGPAGRAQRTHLAGLTIDVGELFRGDDAPTTVVGFSAQQHIANGTLVARHSSARHGVLETVAFVHPALNVLVVNCSWTPATPANGTVPATASAAAASVVAAANVTVATWTYARMQNYNPNHGGLNPGQTWPLIAPVTAGLTPEGVQWITRSTTPDNVTTPRAVHAAVATATSPGATAVAVVDQFVLHAGAKNQISQAATVLTLQAPAKNAASFTVITAVADNLLRVADAPELVAVAAAAVAAPTAAPGAVAAAATEHWRAFWGRSRVRLPTQPLIEHMWLGAQYILGVSASSDPRVPAPGLFGPFVTWDVNGWNGDYTLDYNFEATFYGAFGSNHGGLAEGYFQAVLDGLPAARRGAAARAAAHNITDCVPGAAHFNAHIAPWGFGDYDEEWEWQTGQHMHWNGPFASMLFINHWEYTRNATFLREATFPLLTGLLDFWACYLTNATSSSSSAAGWELVDWPDQCAEGQTVANPVMALAFLSRIAASVGEMARALGVAAPPAAAEIATHLAAFHSNATNASEGATAVWTNFDGATVTQSNLWAMYPVWPAEHYSHASNEAVLAVARASAVQYLNLPNGRCVPCIFAPTPPLSHSRFRCASFTHCPLLHPSLYSPVQTFAAAVRAGVSGSAADASSDSAGGPQFTAAAIVEGMNAHLSQHFGANLLTYTSGGGIENVGMSRAVNEMLVACEGGVVQLFPAWPASEPASFYSLRVKGGFLVTADWDGLVGPQVGVMSAVGGMVTVMDPWPPSKARSSRHSNLTVFATAQAGQTSVAHEWTDTADAHRDFYAVRFNTTAGTQYHIILSSQQTAKMYS